MATDSRDVIPLREATRTWFAISLQTFGGPAGQIAVMQHKLVDEKRWIGKRRFLHALNYCMLLPGPEAQQLAIYVGWLLNGVLGGLIAGTLFVLPGVIALLALSALYVGAGSTAAVVGVIANLAVFFALHNLFERSRQLAWGPVDLDLPVLSSWNPVALAITAVALILIFGRKWSTMRTLGVCAALGLVSSVLA